MRDLSHLSSYGVVAEFLHGNEHWAYALQGALRAYWVEGQSSGSADKDMVIELIYTNMPPTIEVVLVIQATLKITALN